MWSVAKDLIGMEFGKLTVIERAENTKQNKAQWLCQCDCGNTKVIAASHLKRGNTVSCGCYRKNQSTTHGKSTTRLYRIWYDMRRRCGDEKRNEYKDYGGRGISVCKEWEEDFEPFYNWAMNNRYDETLTLERIDNSIDYQPSNCKWATRKEQSSNRRSTVYFTVNGNTLSAKELCSKYGFNYSTFMSRLQRGKDVDDFIEKAEEMETT